MLIRWNFPLHKTICKQYLFALTLHTLLDRFVGLSFWHFFLRFQRWKLICSRASRASPSKMVSSAMRRGQLHTQYLSSLLALFSPFSFLPSLSISHSIVLSISLRYVRMWHTQLVRRPSRKFDEISSNSMHQYCAGQFYFFRMCCGCHFSWLGSALEWDERVPNAIKKYLQLHRNMRRMRNISDYWANGQDETNARLCLCSTCAAN